MYVKSIMSTIQLIKMIAINYKILVDMFENNPFTTNHQESNTPAVILAKLVTILYNIQRDIITKKMY